MIALVFSMVSSTVDRISAIFCCSDKGGIEIEINFNIHQTTITQINNKKQDPIKHNKY